MIRVFVGEDEGSEAYGIQSDCQHALDDIATAVDNEQRGFIGQSEHGGGAVRVAYCCTGTQKIERRHGGDSVG
jgi:hypothetical protein